jgi:hypothetical protein
MLARRLNRPRVARLRILLIKGHSLYGGTRLFADHAAAAFRAAGHEADILDLLETSDARAALSAHAASGKADLVFSISILGEFRDAEGRTLSEMYQAPHVVWHVDYILGQFPRLEATPASTALLFIDPTQADAVRATYGEDRFASLGFMPHAAVGEAAPDDDDPEAFAARRPIPLLWSGSFQKPESPFTNVADWLHKPLQDAIDMALAAEWIPPHEATIKAMTARGIDLDEPANRSLIKMAGRVDDAVRRTRRLAFVKAVAKTGIPIRICGVGWEPHLYRFKNATHEGAVDMTRMVELMRQTRVVLNTNVNFGAGSHERPLSAALAGAVAFTDHSRFWDEAFGPDAMAFYRWSDLPAGMSALTALEGDAARCLDLARAGKARVLAGHTWAHRVDMILAAAESVRPLTVSTARS